MKTDREAAQDYRDNIANHFKMTLRGKYGLEPGWILDSYMDAFFAGAVYRQEKDAQLCETDDKMSSMAETIWSEACRERIRKTS